MVEQLAHVPTAPAIVQIQTHLVEHQLHTVMEQVALLRQTHLEELLDLVPTAPALVQIQTLLEELALLSIAQIITANLHIVIQASIQVRLKDVIKLAYDFL